MKVWCIGDPIPDGIRALSHAELESEHYQAIRTNPQYRIEWNRLEWEARQEPPITQEDGVQPPETQRKPLEMPERISYQLDQLKAQLLHQQNKLNEHLNKKKVKSKSAF